MVFAARLTQRGHEIHSMVDLLMLYEKAYTENSAARAALAARENEGVKK